MKQSAENQPRADIAAPPLEVLGQVGVSEEGVAELVRSRCAQEVTQGRSQATGAQEERREGKCVNECHDGKTSKVMAEQWAQPPACRMDTGRKSREKAAGAIKLRTASPSLEITGERLSASPISIVHIIALPHP